MKLPARRNEVTLALLFIFLGLLYVLYLQGCTTKTEEIKVVDQEAIEAEGEFWTIMFDEQSKGSR